MIDYGPGWSPICAGRTLVSIDVVLSFNERECWMYSKNPLTHEFRAVLGAKHFCQFYPVGNGECT